MTTIPYSISILNGKAAVFVRGLIQHVDTHPNKIDIPLRPAQKAGMDEVEHLGESISIPYVSKLTKMLETADVITKHRKGKGYVLNKDLNFEDVCEYLEEAEFGTTLEQEDSENDIRLRSAFLDHMQEVGSVRIETEHPLPKILYQLAIEKFKSGKYDMVFVLRDVELMSLDDNGDLDFPVETLHASVTNQKK